MIIKTTESRTPKPLGVTGGIASGKTTVANMLKARGLETIDFDILARQVVEPGKPAFRKIVDYFGRPILQDDGTLDRKRLSGIVFNDTEKLKQLESVIHPAIHEEYLKQLREISEKKPDAMIQAIIPLLIEKNLMDMVDKILVVYIPQEKQIERLIKRDGISREAAETILKSQIPIDEKLKYADFIVRNDETIEETEKQIETVWQKFVNGTSILDNQI